MGYYSLIQFHVRKGDFSLIRIRFKEVKKEEKVVEREFRHENFKNPNLNFKKFEFFYGNTCIFPIKRFHLRNR